MKKIVLSFLFLLFTFYLLLAALAYAQEITILYTGETHAMLYPCSCPKEPDGGVSRRATLLKSLRKNNPNTLVLDSGGFFAGGLMDEHTQNTQLDMQRTAINLKAMELMGYDAVNIGDDEFNFGREFLKEQITKTKLNFISSNLQWEKVSPYLIKETAGIKVGIIGLTPLFAGQKAEGLKIIEPKLALKQTIEELKKQKVNIIILLSHQGESEDLNLLKEVEDIDIFIIGHSRAKEEVSTKIGSTLILRPSWQARHMGKLSLTLKENKITDYRAEELRLSDKISDDANVLAILPRCFSDANCKKEGSSGVCQDAGTLNSRCAFNQAAKVKLLIITPKLCTICDTQKTVNYLKTQFPGLVVSYLYYPDAKADKMLNDFQIKGLPAYFLGKEIEKEKGFNELQKNLEIKGDFYMLKPQFSGIAYFLTRQRIKGKLDLFISLYDKDSAALLEMIEEFNPDVHFLAAGQQDKFEAAKGELEVEDCLRAVCIQKYYPQKFFGYIRCRAKNINSSWWEDCADNLDTGQIKNCAKGQEGKGLLKENIGLNKELQIMFGPTYLLDNQEAFGTQGVPPKEEFKRLLDRK